MSPHSARWRRSPARPPPAAERRAASLTAVSSLPRLRARREDELEQIRLAILLEREDAPGISLKAEQRRRLRDLMAEAIIAVHRAGSAGEEGSDDDVRE